MIGHRPEVPSGSRIRTVFANMMLMFVGLAIVAGFVWAGRAVIDAAPGGWVTDRVTVAPGPGPVILRQTDLGAHPPEPWSAGLQMRVTADAAAGWRLANQQPAVPLSGRTAVGRPLRLDSWELRKGDRIDMPAGTLTVEVADGAELVLATADGRHARWRDGVLDVPEADGCLVCRQASSGLFAAMVEAVRRESRRLLDPDGVLFTVGGGVGLPDRWAPLPGLEPETLTVLREAGRFWLAVRRGFAGQVAVRREGAAPEELGAGGLSVGDPIDGLAWRRTRFDLSVNDGALVFGARVGGRDLRPDLPAVPDRVRVEGSRLAWVGSGPGLGDVFDRDAPFLILGGVSVAALAAAIAAGRRRSRLMASAGGGGVWAAALYGIPTPALVTVLTVCLAIHGPHGSDLGVALLLPALAFAVGTVTLAMAGRLAGLAGAVWLCMLTMAGYGLLTQLTLAVDLPNESGVGGVWKHAVSLTVVAIAATVVGLFSEIALFALARGLLLGRHAGVLRVATALAVPLSIAAEVAVGSEVGVGGVQPVEVAKIFLILVMAVAAMDYLHHIYWSSLVTRWWRLTGRLVATCLLLLTPVVAGLIVVGDLSPVAIFGAAILATVFATAVIALGLRPRMGAAAAWALLSPGIALLAIASLIGFALWFQTARAGLAMDGPWATALVRLRLFEEPLAHPNSGWQVLASLRVVAHAPIWPALQPAADAPVWTVPLVSTDFVAAAVIGRLGVVAAAGLAMVQLVYLALVLALAVRAASWGGGRPGQRQLGLFAATTMAGILGAQGAQFFLPWANVVSLLPAVGQPMSLIALANSHILGFAMPVLLLLLITAWLDRYLGAASLPAGQR